MRRAIVVVSILALFFLFGCENGSANRTWQVVGQWSGVGWEIKETDPFVLPSDDCRLSWVIEADCDAFSKTRPPRTEARIQMGVSEKPFYEGAYCQNFNDSAETATSGTGELRKGLKGRRVYLHIDTAYTKTWEVKVEAYQ